MAIAISRRLLGAAVFDRLTTLLAAGSDGPLVLVYRGDIVAGDQVDQPQPVETSAAPDPSGRLGPYVVVYSGVGSPGLEPDLGEAGQDLLWSCLLHVSGPYDADTAQTVDRVHAALYRWQPVIAGLSCGLMKPPPGYDPGPLRFDATVQPPRFWTPLQWQVPVTA